MKTETLETGIETFFKYLTSSMYIALPCRIVSIKTNLTEQRIDVQPLNNRILPDGESKEHSTILNVPVIFPASKTASVTFPLDVGDSVLCIFSQRSMDNFKAGNSDETFTARDKRRFDVRDAIAVPGLFSFKDAINDPAKRKWTHSTRDMVMVNNIGEDTECEFRLKENGNIEVRTDQDFYATFADGVVDCDNLTINASGDVTVNATNVTVDASSAINMTSQTTTMSSGGATDITAGSDLALNAATWTVNVSGTTTVTAPTTNWTGNFNLTGALGLAGPLTAAGGGGGGDSATINMPLNINESITVTGGDVTADGISLKTHVHGETGTGGGTTTPPQ